MFPARLSWFPLILESWNEMQFVISLKLGESCKSIVVEGVVAESVVSLGQFAYKKSGKTKKLRFLPHFENVKMQINIFLK